jgi:hypothetical protein
VGEAATCATMERKENGSEMDLETLVASMQLDYAGSESRPLRVVTTDAIRSS